MKKKQVFLFVVLVLLITGCTKATDDLATYKNETLGFELSLPKEMMDSEFFKVDESSDQGSTTIMFTDGEETADQIYSGGVVFAIVKSESKEGYSDEQLITESEGMYYFFITPDQPIEDTAFEVIFKKYEPSLKDIKASFKQ